MRISGYHEQDRKLEKIHVSPLLLHSSWETYLVWPPVLKDLLLDSYRCEAVTGGHQRIVDK